MKLLLKTGRKAVSLTLMLMLVLTLVPAMPAYAASVSIDAANFPDETFRNYVKTNFDTNSDGSLSDAEITAVTEISIVHQKIKDLKGVEHLRNLSHLSCYENELKTLDVTKNTALEVLFCHNNQLTDLDVTKNTALVKLCCKYNKLTTLDLTKNTALEDMNCDGNELTDLDVTKNTALVFLRCHDNKLTTLDVTKNTALRFLHCYNNQLTSLDLSKNTKIVNANFVDCTGQIRYVYPIGGKLNFSQLPAGFDKAKVSDLTGGNITGDAFMFTGNSLSYKYDTDLTVAGNTVFLETTLKIPSGEFHDVKVRNDGNGTASADKAKAKYGEEVTLTATPKPGYRLNEWKPLIEGIPGVFNNKFTMPDNDVSYEAVFERFEYDITVTPGENGSAAASPKKATPGTAITLTASPDSGYKFKEWKVISGGVTVSSDNTFDMPHNDVNIKPIFEKIIVSLGEHSITTKNDGNGTLTSDKSSATLNDKVTLTATPNPGYKFSKWETTPAGLEINSENQFTMPDENVSVKAIFSKSSSGGGIGGFALPPVDAAAEELKNAKDNAIKAIEELLKAQTFSGEELKKADEIKKDFEAKLEKAETVEEVKKLREEALAAIDKLWSDEELSLKEKVEAVSKADLIAKTKVSSTKSGKRAIRVSWTKVEGMDFDGFEIFKSTSKSKFSNSPVFTAKGNKSSYLNSKNLRKGKTYYYRVRAFKVINGEKVYTGWSTKTWKTPKK